MHCRIRAGFSQRKLARESNLSSPFISQLENGTRNAGPQAAKAICASLDCGFEEIFELISVEESEKGMEVGGERETSRSFFNLRRMGRPRFSS
ncbi:helix-turn-helix transcriptional regulator [Tumebacillus flagellatus]|nr:helix-turn-helix transcriptional regulator [Tumebacillus flagellatus]